MKNLQLEESNEEDVDQEEESIQVQDEEQDQDEKEDIFCSPEDKVWEARKKQIDARVTAWKRKIRAEVLAELMAKQNGKDGEVVDARADGQTVCEAKAEKDDDFLKTPLKPKTQKTLTIIENENSDVDITPKMIKRSALKDEEEEARRPYEESV